MARILVVDDDQTKRSMIHDMLRHVNHEVIEAESAEHTLEILAQAGPFDIVIADFSFMPRTNGMEFTKNVRLHHPTRPPSIIMVSETLPETVPDITLQTPIMDWPAFLEIIKQLQQLRA